MLYLCINNGVIKSSAIPALCKKPYLRMSLVVPSSLRFVACGRIFARKKSSGVDIT